MAYSTPRPLQVVQTNSNEYTSQQFPVGVLERVLLVHRIAAFDERIDILDKNLFTTRYLVKHSSSESLGVPLTRSIVVSFLIDCTLPCLVHSDIHNKSDVGMENTMTGTSVLVGYVLHKVLHELWKHFVHQKSRDIELGFQIYI